jgi:hypothetical protein
MWTCSYCVSVCVCDFYCAATQLKAPRTVLGIVRYTNLIGLDWIGCATSNLILFNRF